MLQAPYQWSFLILWRVRRTLACVLGANLPDKGPVRVGACVAPASLAYAPSSAHSMQNQCPAGMPSRPRQCVWYGASHASQRRRTSSWSESPQTGHGRTSSSSNSSSIQAFGSNSATCFLSSTSYSDTTVPGEKELAFELFCVYMELPLSGG